METANLFRQSIDAYVQQALNVEFLLDEIRYGLLRNIVEHCFRQKGYRLSRQKKAEVILSVLFSRLVRGFDFDAFLEKIPHSEQKGFLTALLYHIFYINLTLEHLARPELLFFYLFRVLASHSSEKTIESIFQRLSYAEQMRLVGFCLEYFDEGAHRILLYVGKFGAQEMRELLRFVEAHLIDKRELVSWIASEPEMTVKSVKHVLGYIEKDIDARLQRVASFLALPFNEVKKCLKIFGLYHHQVPQDQVPQDENCAEIEALDEKLAALSNTGAKIFSESIKKHIVHLAHSPEKYVEGIHSITYALPTKGKDLSLLAWLPSVVDGLNAFCDYFQIKNDIPIIVFDQSDPKRFKKNGKYLKTLQANVVHIDEASILKIAKKLDVTGLIVTDPNGQFGYGGARNTIFLIAPLIKYYYLQKRLTDSELVEYLVSLPSSTLKRDLEEIVLTEKRGPCVVHMGDDDVHVPASTIFSDALFAERHKGEFFFRFGWVIGRKTTWTETTFNLEYMLARASDILLQHQWTEVPFRHGMSGLLTKPKLCLNLPFGQEEAHFVAMHEYSYDFRLPSVHLSGYRFPKTQLPTNRLSGLAEFLKAHYKYSIGALLISDLVDPLDVQKRNILPWNGLQPFENLKAAIEYMIKPKTSALMQKQFDKNVRFLAQALQAYKPMQRANSDEEQSAEEKVLALYHLGVLGVLDIPKLLADYRKGFKRESEELQVLFEHLIVDARCFMKVLLGSKKRYPESTFPLTHALQLLMDVIKANSFQKQLKKLG